MEFGRCQRWSGAVCGGAVVGCLVFLVATAAGQDLQADARAAAQGLSPTISAEDLHTHVAYIASDACEGRLTGSAGVRRAAVYLAHAFELAGLKPGGADGGCMQPFEFSAGVKLDAQACRLAIAPKSDEAENGKATPTALDKHFRPLTFSGSGEARGEVVFVGFGLVVPEGEGKGGQKVEGYDSYMGMDVKGKVVLALRDLPEEITPQRRQQLALFAGDRYKAKLAADRGAAAFLLVNGPNSPDAGKLEPFDGSNRTAGVEIPCASISGDLADEIVAPADVTLAKLQAALDAGVMNPHVNVSTGTNLELAVKIERVRGTCQNVIAILPPTGGVDEYVVVGGHYDHLGHGGPGMGSLAHQDEVGQVHNGADDNASGTAVVAELAGRLAADRATAGDDRPRRGVVFACWSGEEIGLVGSAYYVKHPAVPLDKTVAYFNFDMVGRLRDGRLIVQAVGSSEDWPALIEQCAAGAELDLIVKKDPYLPTDSTSFYTSGVPGLAFFTDLHDEYNRPVDDADSLNYAGMERIATLAEKMIARACEPGEKIAFARVAQTSAPMTSRMRRRTYTGVVPNMAVSDVRGVLLADVQPGSPAADAGLQSGDVIVEFAGQKVASLRDYADALLGAKIGETVPVVIEREGTRVEMKITPAERKR